MLAIISERYNNSDGYIVTLSTKNGAGTQNFLKSKEGFQKVAYSLSYGGKIVVFEDD